VNCISDSKGFTERELDDLHPLPIKCDIKKLKEDKIKRIMEYNKKEHPNMTDDELLKMSKEDAKSGALLDAILFLYEYRPQCSSDEQIASFLLRTSIDRELHTLFLEKYWNKSSDIDKLVVAEFVRDWVVDTWTKYKDDSCAIGITLIDLNLQYDVHKVRQPSSRIRERQ
jgi:hypothetical protein